MFSKIPSQKSAARLPRINPHRPLSFQQRKEIVKMVKAAKDKSRNSVQEGVPYKEMYRDGICWLGGRSFSKTIEFFDLNYRNASKETKSGIFERWCDFLNYIRPNVQVEFTFIDSEVQIEDLWKFIHIPDRDDKHNELRQEFRSILRGQLGRGNNGLQKRKFITFGIEADTLGGARTMLQRIESEILQNFHQVGCAAKPMNGLDRLVVLHDIFNAGTGRRFNFHWDLVAKTGLTTKDFICPDSIHFEKNYLTMGKRYASASYLQIMASELDDEMLIELLDMDSPLIFSMHIQAVDQQVALKQIKRVLTDVDKMKIEENKKAVKGGYDIDILPPDLRTYSKEAESMLENLQYHNEQMFLITFLFVNEGDSKEKLTLNLETSRAIAEKKNCRFRALEYQQQDGLMSALPLGGNSIEIKRQLSTSAAAILIPFTSQELFMPNGLYYGVNTQTHNMIMIDRKAGRDPNGLFLGTPGGGKSFAAKREQTNVILSTDDDLMTIDPEREYSPLGEAFDGQVIKVASDSPHYINPMDINLNYAEGDNPLALKNNFILSFCELIFNGQLQPIEVSILDRCLLRIYQNYLNVPSPDKMPILEDLFNMLHLDYKEKKLPEALYLATGLELYVHGSQNIFNHRTNVDIHNRHVVFDTKDLGSQLKKLGMLIIQDQMWNRVSANRGRKATRVYLDEFHLLLKEEQTAKYSAEIWKRFRKWQGIPTGITQNVKDLLASRQIENIFDNSSFIYLLNQAPGDREILAEYFGISESQLEFITNSQPGSGLVIFDGKIVPFTDSFPRDTKLYQLMTTKPEDLAVTA